MKHLTLTRDEAEVVSSTLHSLLWDELLPEAAREIAAGRTPEGKEARAALDVLGRLSVSRWNDLAERWPNAVSVLTDYKCEDCKGLSLSINWREWCDAWICDSCNDDRIRAVYAEEDSRQDRRAEERFQRMRDGEGAA